MCSRCDGFLETRRVDTPYEYRDLARQILEIVEENTFRLVTGTCPLDEILTARPWPADYVYHVLECTTCSRRFELGVDTYHGRGEWRVMSSPPQSSRPQ